MCTESLFREAAKRRLDASIHASRLALAGDAEAVAAYDRLLLHVRSTTGMLARRSRSSERRLDVNKALVAMALHHADWLAPVEAWRPSVEPAWRVLAQLAAHLFARYAMPQFMTSVWLEGERGKTAPQQAWYKRLGRGENLRRLGLPMRITRAMAHLFSRSPDHLSAVAALRRAQVLALGGSDELARAIVATRLGRALEHEDFWETVVQFFVNHPELAPEQVGPIVDFLQHQKLEWREGVTADGELALLPPPQPELAMKGRTPRALERLVESWHRELGMTGVGERRWPRSGIGGFRWVERVTGATDGEARSESRLWTISELCSSTALIVEGRAMRHCVASYVYACVQRRTTIWSMQLETRLGRRRVVTIEVDAATRRIRQVRRKCNRVPSPAEHEVLRLWAARERLTVPSTA